MESRNARELESEARSSAGRPIARARPAARHASAVTVASAVILSIGCGSSSAPPSRSPEFLAVQAIFDAHCVGCHNASITATPGHIGYPDLPLTVDRSYAGLVNRPAHEACGGVLVVPGSAATSYLLQKLTADTPCEGARMPTGEAILLPPLPQADLDTITAWIAAGAAP